MINKDLDRDSHSLNKPLINLAVENNYGLGKQSLKLLPQRMELNVNNVYDPKNKLPYDILQYVLSTLFNKKYSYRSKLLTNISLLNLMFCYRGWRHFKGLPCRGQRTWTNAWSSFRNNTPLKRLMLRIARNVYGNFNENTLMVAISAEHYNTLWYKQWYNEWSGSKKRRIKYFKNSKNVCIVDLNSAAQGKISGSNRPAKPGKKKRVYKKNSFTIGFNRGATKWLVSDAMANENGGPITLKTGQLVQVLLSAPSEKKKNQKKVSSQKKKQDKLANLEKKKKANKQKGNELKKLQQQKMKNTARK